MRPPRYNRSKKVKHVVHNGVTYDSSLEATLHKTSLEACKFHDKDNLVKYVVSHSYEPDFTFYSEEQDLTYLIEVKGFFRQGDVQKYKAINQQLPEKTELVFVLSDPNKPVSKRTRKDGTKRCMREVVEKTIKCRCFDKDEFDLLRKITQPLIEENQQK